MAKRKLKNRLLLLACSRKKKDTAGLLPALIRYDGPAFQILRKFIALRPDKAAQLDVYVLSAKFGLIPVNKPITCYDKKMTQQTAATMNRQVLSVMQKLFSPCKYKQLFINVGQDYGGALAGYEKIIPNNLEIITSTGSSGHRQAELYDWLYGEPPKQTGTTTGTASIRGVTLNMTPEDVLDRAIQALNKTQSDSSRFQSWYVPVSGNRVSPKWLVSQLTGLPVGAFVTDEARRVLAKLGIEVVRV